MGYLKMIPLRGKWGKGRFALVSIEDYEQISKHKYYVGKHGYAVRDVVRDGKKMAILMHREIMGFPEGKEVDHKNRNKLHNFRSNLRICNSSQNSCNTRKFHHNSTSKYKGIYWSNERKCWRVELKHNGVKYHGGSFDSEDEAALAYNILVIKHHGTEFCYLNDIPEGITSDFKHDKKRNKTSGVKGISFNKQTNKWEVYYDSGKDRVRLGRYKNIEDAKLVLSNYLKGELRYG